MKIKVKATFTYFIEAASCEEAFNPACDAIGAICFECYRGEGETTVLSDKAWEKELKALLERKLPMAQAIREKRWPKKDGKSEEG